MHLFLSVGLSLRVFVVSYVKCYCVCQSVYFLLYMAASSVSVVLFLGTLCLCLVCVSLYICLFMSLLFFSSCGCRSVCLCQPTRLPVSLLVHMLCVADLFLCVSPSVSVSVCQSVCRPVCLSVSVSVCLSVCLSVCRPLSLSHTHVRARTCVQYNAHPRAHTLLHAHIHTHAHTRHTHTHANSLSLSLYDPSASHNRTNFMQ